MPDLDRRISHATKINGRITIEGAFRIVKWKVPAFSRSRYQLSCPC